MATPNRHRMTEPSDENSMRAPCGSLNPAGGFDARWVNWLAAAAQDRTTSRIEFISDHVETGSDAPKGARCLAELLKTTAQRLNDSAACLGRRCAIRLRVVDTIHFDCKHPFLATILNSLISNAIFSEATDIEVFATEYENHLFIQIADNGLSRHHIADQQHVKTAKQGAHSLEARSIHEVLALLLDVLGGELELISSSAQRATRVGLKLPLSPKELAYG